MAHRSLCQSLDGIVKAEHELYEICSLLKGTKWHYSGRVGYSFQNSNKNKNIIIQAISGMW